VLFNNGLNGISVCDGQRLPGLGKGNAVNSVYDDDGSILANKGAMHTRDGIRGFAGDEAQGCGLGEVGKRPGLDNQAL
jgi:hypothetical protein